MNPKIQSLKLGLRRGWIETKHSVTSPQDMFWSLFMTSIFVLVMWLQRNNYVDGVQLALISLPGVSAFMVAFGGLTGAAGALSAEREDGTLLRAKATPQGMFAYLISRVMYLTLTTLVSLTTIMVTGLLIVNGVADIGVDGVALFIALFVLGLLATVPIGAAVGSMVKSSGSGFGLAALPMMVLAAISGIFYPITALAGWLQAVAQVFPLYWLGHGMRSVFLPEGAAVAEIGGTWRPGVAVAILIVWSVIGLVVGPPLLRKMARKVSGSEMQAGRERFMKRGY